MPQAVATLDRQPATAMKAGGALAPIIPQSLAEVGQMADMIASARIAPKGMDQPQQIAIAIMHGMEIGLTPLQAVQSIAVVGNRPAIWGDAMLALCQASGLLVDFEEDFGGPDAGSDEEDGAVVARCRVVRRDRPTPIIRTFSSKQAQTAGLWKKAGPWTQYPRRMLQLRARAFALRDAFPDVLKGIAAAEEARDIPAAAEPAAHQTATSAELLAAAQMVEPEDNPEPPAPAAAAKPPTPEAEPTPPAAAEPPKPATTPEEWPGWTLVFFRELHAKKTEAEIDVHCKTPKLLDRLAEIETWPDGDTLIGRFWETVEDIKAGKAHA